MKVISIGTDRGMFKNGSPVQLRTLEYAKRVEEYHVVVFTLKKEKHKEIKINNLYIYPTDSLSQWLYIKNALKLCKKIITSNKFDKSTTVLSTQDVFQTGFVGIRLSKKFGFPLQVQIHNDFLSSHFSKSFFNVIRKFIAYSVIPKAQGIRVVNDIIKDSLVRKWRNIGDKVSVLPIFVDVQKIIETRPLRDIQKDFPEWKFIIFMASRLTEEKGFDTAIKTLRKVVDVYPHTGLVIAGSGPEKLKIEKMVKILKLEKNVSLIGWQEDLISYYKTCNVFLLTSKHEGYGMTLIEAGASGAMVVTTKVGVAKTSLFVDEVNCHVCPVGNYDCLANCIIGVIRDNQRRELFAQNLQHSIKNALVTPEVYYTKYVSLLESLLQK